MVKNSYLLMGLINICIVFATIYLAYSIYTYQHKLEPYKIKIWIILILFGLTLLSILSVLDFLIMFILPAYTSPNYSMNIMTNLHINWRWPIIFISVLCITVGLSYLIKRLLEKISTGDEYGKLNASLLKEITSHIETQNLAMIGSWELDLDKNHLSWSDQIFKIFEIDKNLFDPSYEAFLESIHPDDLDYVNNSYTESVKSKTPYNIEHRLLMKDGRIKYVNEICETFYNNDGNPVRSIGTVRDITYQKQATDALNKSEEKFAKAINVAPEAMYFTRAKDGFIMLINPAFTTLFGYSEIEAIGKTSIDLGLWVDVNDREKMIKTITMQKEIKGLETFLRSSAGERIPVSMSNALMEFSGEKWIVGFARDLRGDKKAEYERQQLEHKLFLSQKMEAIGQLTSGIAHDFNNILQGILGYNYLAQKIGFKSGDNTLIEYLKIIQESGEQAQELVKQLLTYTRAIPGKVSRQSISPLVDKTLQLLRSTIPSTIILQTDIPETLPDVNIDPTQFGQVLMNLCINSRDAIVGNGKIDIVASTIGHNQGLCNSCFAVLSGEYVVLEVIDSGTGISNEIKSKIFDPFFSTKDIGQASGMGLSVVHGILHSWNGHIQVKSSTETETIFRLLLPRMGNAVEVAETMVPHDLIEHAHEMTNHTGVIMVVDDELRIVNILKSIFMEQGYDVITFTNSEEALAHFRQAPDEVDLVITDQIMPGITGINLAKEMLLLRPKLPIILFSGRGIKEDELIGITAFYTKPINFSALLEKIEELVKLD